MNIQEFVKQRTPTSKLSEANSIRDRMLNRQTDVLTEPISAQYKEVTLLVRGFPERYFLHYGMPIVIGRYDVYTGNDVDLDLTLYGGVDRGVSRNHAQLELGFDGFVYLTDLGSTNGTFLRGERLTPNKRVRLMKGDRFIVGCLSISIMIKSS